MSNIEWADFFSKWFMEDKTHCHSFPSPSPFPWALKTALWQLFETVLIVRVIILGVEIDPDKLVISYPCHHLLNIDLSHLLLKLSFLPYTCRLAYSNTLLTDLHCSTFCKHWEMKSAASVLMYIESCSPTTSPLIALHWRLVKQHHDIKILIFFSPSHWFSTIIQPYTSSPTTLWDPNTSPFLGSAAFIVSTVKDLTH